MAKTLPFHGSNMGSIPIRCIALRQRATASPLNGVLRLEVALVLPPEVQGRGSVVGLR